ncbi:MAG: transglutaminase-like cysteine peptidase [Pseudomonadota bacterium]
MHFLKVSLKAISSLGLAALVSGAVMQSSALAFEQMRSTIPETVHRTASTSTFQPQPSDLANSSTRQNGLKARSNTVLARRWSMARPRLEAEKNWLRSCEKGACRDPRADTWHKAVSLVRASPSQSRPARVQQLISRGIRYVRDKATDDHWATPLSTLLRKAGDCEDHVLLKRAILEAAGTEPTDTRLLILKTAQGEGHMVLQVLGNRQVILDNRFRYPVDAKHLGQDRIAAVVSGDGFFGPDQQSEVRGFGL